MRAAIAHFLRWLAWKVDGRVAIVPPRIPSVPLPFVGFGLSDEEVLRIHEETREAREERARKYGRAR